MTFAKKITAATVGKYIADVAIDGAWTLAPADEVAKTFLEDPRFPNHDERVKSLIRWQAARNFGSGFVASVGGPLTMALGIPAALAASYVIQARMGAAIAIIYGHDIRDERVRTFVLLTLVANDLESSIKGVGIAAGQKFTLAAIKRIPSETIKKINEKVGFRLITIAGEKGVINLTKVVPFVGGVIGGTFDGACCYSVGHVAKRCFQSSFEASPEFSG